MAISDKWTAGGTIDVSSGITAIPKAYKVGKVPNQNAQMSFGYYVKTHWTEPEAQPSLMDTTYGYCATDGNFCVNTGVLWNCGYSNPSFNRYKRYDLSSSVQNAIGFGRFYPDKGTYANIGIYGGTGASSYKEDASNTPLTDYLNGKNARNTATFSSKPQVYGRNLTPVVSGFSLKDVMYVPVIMAYKLSSGANPASATKAEMQAYYYRLSSIDAYENVEYKEYPYIMGVYMQPVFMNIENKTVSTGFTNGFTGFCNGEYKITTGVYDDSGSQKDQSITYYPLYGDNNSTETTLDGWYEWRPEETDPTKRSKWASHPSMHPFCIMGYGSNGSEWNKQLIRVDGSGNYASGGKLILTGDWLKTSLLEVSSSEKWIKIYSDAMTDANVHAFCEYVRRQAAYMGGFFRCDGRLDLIDYRLIDEGTYMGVIDGSGITHGDYTKGVENAKNPSFDWTDAINDTNFKPGGGGGPTSGGDHDREKSDYGGSDFVTNSLKIGDVGLRRYVVDGSDFSLFNRFCKECVDYDLAREQFIAGAMGQGASRSDAAKYWSDRFKDEADYKSKMYSKLGYGLDPRNNIVSLMMVPYNVFGFGASEFMKVGDYQINSKFTTELATGSGTTADIQYAPSANLPGMGDIFNTQFKLCTNDVFNINIGEIVVQHPKGWEDFRAFEPYSRCELYIPFHGNVAINLNQCMGKTLKIVVLMDIITGSSYACVTINGKLYQAIPGQIGFNIPYSVEASSTTATTLSGLTAQAQSNKLQSSNNLVNGILSTVGNLADGNGLGALNSVVGTYQNAKQLGINERALNFQLAHACDGRSVANAATPLTALCANGTPQLIWHHPIMLAYNDNEYGNLVGYATQRTGRIGSFKGYTKFNNANLSSLSCTETEKGMILAQLQNGVYID